MDAVSACPSSAGLNDLVSAAVRAGVPSGVAEHAWEITRARFRSAGSARVSERARWYFWGVVRRAALRGSAPALRESMLALSLADELRSAGHSEESVRREVQRRHGVGALLLVGGHAVPDIAA